MMSLIVVMLLLDGEVRFGIHKGDGVAKQDDSIT